jgi:hypothetical protein
MEVDHNITRELASTYLKAYTKYVRNMCKVKEICDYGIHGTSSKVRLKTNFIFLKIGYIALNKVEDLLCMHITIICINT